MLLIFLIIYLRRFRIYALGAVRKALKTSLRDLKKAGMLAQDPAGAAEAAGMTARAVKSYLGARMGIGEGLIDQDAIASIKAVPDDLKSRVTDLIGDLDKMRFAPGQSSVGEIGGLVDRARELIGTVEDKWRE